MRAGCSFSLLLLVLLAGPSFVFGAQEDPAGEARIVFTKEFPGSNPDYYSIELRRNGEAAIRFSPDEKPATFPVSEAPTQEIFALAERLNRFQNVQLESSRKVAQMGRKAFSFSDGAVRGEASYNHTENPDALALTALFERLSNTQQHRDRIEYLLRFDRLGIVKELLQLEMDFDNGRLLEAQLLLPSLQKVLANKELVNVAHQRATGIVSKIQAAAN